MNNEAFVELRYIDNRSDKVYKLSLERYEKDADNCGWVVNFAYGRYGKPLKTGTKTPHPRGFDAAELLYNKLMVEKLRKGYVCTDTEAGAPAASLRVIQGDKTAWLPQLLNPINPEDLIDVWDRFSPNCYVQTKHDGERRGIIIGEDGIIPANRRGLRTTVSPEIMEDLERLIKNKEWQGILDCEDMGDHLVIFDYIPIDDKSTFMYKDRVIELEYINDDVQNLNLEHVRVERALHITSYAGLKGFAAVEALDGEEGIVIRDGLGVYTPGKPNSGGSCLKLKFWNDCTVMVGSIHPTKRSIGMKMWSEDLALTTEPGWIDVGNCTIPANYDIPEVYDLVDVKYLYAYPGGSIYQPQYKGVRTDLKASAATTGQLTYKKV